MMKLNLRNLSTCALGIALCATPLQAMINEDGESVSSSVVPKYALLSADETARRDAFKTRLNGLLKKSDEMILMRLGFYFNHPNTPQTQECLPFVVWGEKLLEQGLFDRITNTRGGETVPLDQQLPDKTPLLTYLVILAKSGTLLEPRSEGGSFPGRGVMGSLSAMSLDQIEACERNSEALYLREEEADEIYRGLFSKPAEEIYALAQLIAKHKAALFFGQDDQRLLQAGIVKELIKLPLPYLEKNLATLFPKEMSLLERARAAAKRVSKIQKILRKRGKKVEIQKMINVKALYTTKDRSKEST